MLDRLLDLLVNVWQSILPWIVLDEWQRAVVLRLGRFHRDIGPGFHWVIPFAECAYYESVVPDTHLLAAQPLTTRDGVPVSVQAMLLYQIRDVRKLLLVGDKTRALHDSAAGIIAAQVASGTWDQLTAGEVTGEAYKAIRARGFRYGIEVMELQFAGLQKSRSYMLLQNHKYE